MLDTCRVEKYSGLFRSAIAFALVISSLSGCVQTPPEETFTPPTADIRQQFGVIAVIPVACESAYSVPTPARESGAGASTGAAQGAFYGMQPGMALCAGGLSCILGAPAMLAGGLLGALAGSVVGSAKAHSTEEVTASETALRQAMTSTSADEMLADLIVTKAAKVGFTARVQHRDNQPLPEVSGKENSESALLINMPIFALFGEGEIEPEVNLVIGVQAIIAKTVNLESTWSRSWIYRSTTQSFFDLAKDGSKRLHEEIDVGLAAIATKMVADVFVTSSPESSPDITRFGDLPAGIVRPVLYLERMHP